MPFCPECGVEMQNAQKYCHACGMEIGRVDGEVDSIPNQPSADLPPSIHFNKGGMNPPRWWLDWPKFFEKSDIPSVFEKIETASGIEAEEWWGGLLWKSRKYGELVVRIAVFRKKNTFWIGGTEGRSEHWYIIIPVIGWLWMYRKMRKRLNQHIQTAERLASAIESLLPPAN